MKCETYFHIRTARLLSPPVHFRMLLAYLSGFIQFHTTDELFYTRNFNWVTSVYIQGFVIWEVLSWGCPAWLNRKQPMQKRNFPFDLLVHMQKATTTHNFPGPSVVLWRKRSPKHFNKRLMNTCVGMHPQCSHMYPRSSQMMCDVIDSKILVRC